MAMDDPRPDDALALGLDAGGTSTRWALARREGEVVAEGEVAGFSALEVQGPGHPRVVALLEELARAVQAAGRPGRIHAGLTGFDGEGRELAAMLARPFGLAPGAVTLGSDIETAYRYLFQPGEGYVVYAGTGSIAAYIDADGALHRAGGRGVLLDDGGGGYWIARQALRRIWRAEDERPGAWRDSVMAQELFAMMGGPEWAHTRQFVYQGRRGDVGRLALAVARAADHDPEARDILVAAGRELARLGRAMIARYGPRPVALSGRAATLHPLIRGTMEEGLPVGTPFAFRPCLSHHAAAFLALDAPKPDPTPSAPEAP